MTDQLNYTESEKKLIDHIGKNECADYTPAGQQQSDINQCPNWGEDRKIRVEVIRDILLGKRPERPVAGAIRIKGAKIIGLLDLMGVTTCHGLIFEYCCICDGVNLTFADMPFCMFTDCAANWFVAQSLRTGMLSLDRTVFSNFIDIRSARIAGNVSCVNTQCMGNNSQPALNAQQIRVEGSLLLKGLQASGAVTAQGVLDLSGASVDGQLSLNDASASNTVGAAVVAENIKVGASVFLINGMFCGGVTLTGSKIGRAVFCRGSRFIAGQTGEAFVADAVDVQGSVQLGFPIGSNGPPEAITRYLGLVRLPRAKIGDNLDCDRAFFALAMKSSPAIRESDGPPETVVADGIEVRGAVRFRGACLCGAVGLPNAKIGGDLDFSGAKFCGPSGLVAEHASVGGRFLWRNIRLNRQTELDLLDTRVSILADDCQSWPIKGKLIIDGLTYDRIGFGSPTDSTSRLDWLSRMGSRQCKPELRIGTPSTLGVNTGSKAALDTQPYRQLVRVLRNEDQGHSAQLILVSLAGRQWGHSEWCRVSQAARCIWAWLSRPAGWLYRLIGYGYRPLPGVCFLAVAIVLSGWLFLHFCAAGVMVQTTNHADPFSPFWYSLDVFLPTHPLHQVDHWWPKVDNWRFCFCWPSELTIPWGWSLRLWVWFETLGGWILTGLFITGITGIVRRE